MELIQQMEHLAWLKARAKRSKAVADARIEEAKAYEAEMFGQLEDLGLPRFDTRKYTFVPKTTVRAYVNDINAFREWAEKEGELQSYTKEDIQKARLNELVRERLERQQDLPPGVAWYPQQYISTTER